MSDLNLLVPFTNSTEPLSTSAGKPHSKTEMYLHFVYVFVGNVAVRQGF